MAWLESHQGLARHIKTKRLARKLKISVPAVIGHLHLLWWWAMDNLPDGCLSLLEPEDIADEMMWTGNANELLEALIDVGFIDEIDDQLYIHDWHDYIGRLVEKRKTDAERKRTSRKKSDRSPKDVQRTSNGHPKEIQQTSDGIPSDGAGNSTVPNSTVPNNNDDDDTNSTYARVIDFYQKNIGMIAPAQYEYIDDWLKTYDADVLILAIRRAVDQGVPKWSYINKTLDGWLKRGAKTLSDCEAQIVEFEREKEERYAKSQTGHGQARSGRDPSEGSSGESEFAFLGRAGRS